MPSKQVEFHEEAAREYEAAFEWYFARSRQAASRFAEEIVRAVDSISETPERWPLGVHGVRRFLLRRFPFGVFYRDLPSVVQIVAVARLHRRPGYWKDRI
jgi:toxin ParE1/3/4